MALNRKKQNYVSGIDEFVADSTEDLKNLPSWSSLGSSCYVISENATYTKSSGGSWIKSTSNSNNSGSSSPSVNYTAGSGIRINNGTISAEISIDNIVANNVPAGQVPTSDGSGGVEWAEPSSSSGILSIPVEVTLDLNEITLDDKTKYAFNGISSYQFNADMNEVEDYLAQGGSIRYDLCQPKDAPIDIFSTWSFNGVYSIFPTEGSHATAHIGPFMVDIDMGADDVSMELDNLNIVPGTILFTSLDNVSYDIAGFADSNSNLVFSPRDYLDALWRTAQQNTLEGLYSSIQMIDDKGNSDANYDATFVIIYNQIILSIFGESFSLLLDEKGGNFQKIPALDSKGNIIIPCSVDPRENDNNIIVDYSADELFNLSNMIPDCFDLTVFSLETENGIKALKCMGSTTEDNPLWIAIDNNYIYSITTEVKESDKDNQLIVEYVYNQQTLGSGGGGSGNIDTTSFDEVPSVTFMVKSLNDENYEVYLTKTGTEIARPENPFLLPSESGFDGWYSDTTDNKERTLITFPIVNLENSIVVYGEKQSDGGL